MLSHYPRVMFVALLFPLFTSVAFAYTTTFALSGNTAEGVSGGMWNTFSSPVLNNWGDLSWIATLQQDGTNIDTTNDLGVWRTAEGDSLLLARTGVENVPGLTGTSFATFDMTSISDSDDVVVGGKLAVDSGGVSVGNEQGVWRYGDQESLLARTGSGGVPELIGKNFFGLPLSSGPVRVALADDGRVLSVARLQVALGGVTNVNDLGLWGYGAGSANLIAREGVGDVPDLSGASFNALVLTGANNNNQVALFASLKAGNGIHSQNDTGIWRYTGTEGELWAQTGSGNVPDMAGVNFVGFQEPQLNNLGEIAFVGQYTHAGDTGVWWYSDTTAAMLAQSGVGAVPNVPEASFQQFTVNAINDLSHVLVEAVLEPGFGGVTETNQLGIWLLGNDNALLARTGSEGVPGVPEANFSAFQTRSLNNAGQMALAASLELGIGGVNEDNDSGIWILEPGGESVLVAREGDQLAGRTIATLDFQGDNTNQASGLNDVGELAFRATFTDGYEGLFLYRKYEADFDRDGDVDNNDVMRWAAEYSVGSVADADLDGDSDGADFLLWQRQYSNGIELSEATTAVPEPAGLMMLAIGCSFFAQSKHRRNRYRR